jgi:hypothetical protein
MTLRSELVTKGEIARRLGVDPSAVSHWIRRSRSHRMAPRFPKGKTPAKWEWDKVIVWATEWKKTRPRSLPGLILEPDEALEEAIRKAENDLARKEGCTCPNPATDPGTIALNCPVHAKGLL